MRNCRFFKLHRRHFFFDIKQPKAGVKQPKPHPQKRNFGKKTTQKRRQEYLNLRYNSGKIRTKTLSHKNGATK